MFRYTFHPETEEPGDTFTSLRLLLASKGYPTDLKGNRFGEKWNYDTENEIDDDTLAEIMKLDIVVTR